jgi:hypothetical protein
MHAHTITTVLLIGGAWAGVVCITLSVLTVAKRSDEAADRDLSLGDVAREVHWGRGAGPGDGGVF